MTGPGCAIKCNLIGTHAHTLRRFSLFLQQALSLRTRRHICRRGVALAGTQQLRSQDPMSVHAPCTEGVTRSEGDEGANGDGKVRAGTGTGSRAGTGMETITVIGMGTGAATGTGREREWGWRRENERKTGTGTGAKTKRIVVAETGAKTKTRTVAETGNRTEAGTETGAETGKGTIMEREGGRRRAPVSATSTKK